MAKKATARAIGSEAWADRHGNRGR